MQSLYLLKRPFVGERLHRERALLTRAEKREEIRPPTIELPDHGRPEWFGVRKASVRVEARPNAPQLIRLVRHPFTVTAAPFQRQALEQLSLARPERETVAAMVGAAREKVEREPLPRPTDVHPPLEQRSRPSAAAWLAARAAEGER